VLKQRHFLSLNDFSSFDIKQLLDAAEEIKKHPKSFRKTLKGRIFLMLFQQSSFRARVGFEAGIHRLGGIAQSLPADDIRLACEESMADVAGILSRFVDGMVVNPDRHSALVELAEHGTVPVINAGTDRENPCQVLADLLTLREKFGRLEGLKLAYIGSDGSLIHSLLFATARVGMDFTLMAPKDPAHPWLHEILEQAQEEHRKQETRLHVAEDIHAIRGNHAVYVGNWHPSDRSMQGSLVTQEVMGLAGPSSVLLCSTPIHRGREVVGEVVDGPRSVVLEQAENRMWVQMAVMTELMGE